MAESSANAHPHVRLVLVFQLVQRPLYRAFAVEIIHRGAGLDAQSPPNSRKLIFYLRMHFGVLQIVQTSHTETIIATGQISVAAHAQIRVQQMEQSAQ